MRRHCPSALLLVLTLAAPAWGQIVPIGPFSGTYHENTENIGQGGAGGHQQIDVFQGFATVRNTTPNGAIKLEFSSQLGSDLVVPHSPQLFLGQIGISEWTFDAPVSKWGAFWENNSRFDDATVNFFTGNTLIGSVVATDPKAAQTWTWNGWQSSVPFDRITVVGNDTEFLNGFIWWDDLEVTVAPGAVPEPGTLTLLGLAAAGSLGVFYRGGRWGKRRGG